MSSKFSLRPFFIVGSPRSGTTLLRFQVSSHSRLFVPDETGFIPFLVCDPNRMLGLAEIHEVLQRIGQLNRFWGGIVTDVADFYATLLEPRLPYVIDALFRRRCQLQSMTRWGDKTPLYVRYIPQLLAIFPQAQFINVIRDGRDSSLSARAKWGASNHYMDIYYLLRNWQRNVNAGHEARDTLPSGQYLEIRYEALVTEPESVLRQICDFLGESFEPAMLEHTELARRVGGGIDAHIEVQADVHMMSVMRWKSKMTPFEKRLADGLVGDLLLEMDYSLADIGSLTVFESLKAAALAVKFLLTDTTRSLLYRFGIFTLNRNRR